MERVVEGVLPLSDITVVALEQAVAAPFASRQLADLGARVIKVERPGPGDFARQYDRTVHGQSSHFVWLNRTKESMALDVKSDDGKQVLKSLLASADVFIHNLAPGAVERLGFGFEELHALFPKLIVCEISGYGKNGPYSNKKAYDLLIQCETGVVSITGTPDTPSKVGISIADIASGMYAFSSILTALILRGKTGQGTHIEVSMLEALGEWMGYPMYFAAYGGTPPARTGSSHATIFPYGAFAAGDGKSVFFGIQNDREWEQFCTIVLQRPELAKDEQYQGNANRYKHSEELTREILQVFSQISAAEVEQRLDEANIANARLNNMVDFFEHPQLKARGRWREVTTPEGVVRALLPPGTIRGSAVCMGPVPRVGEHTEKIRNEIAAKHRGGSFEGIETSSGRPIVNRDHY
ncbi:CoA transferase [Alicyclobacillus cycloheptanicus]|uniref:Itaconate CoA-transferase n=1 Tax=Alicyclobacillus cycloheptanicus TaxID=1457 RepID=A0ABT9XGV1_9BACL|nr:CaiB/BaiF CoA-transferase family protein [Alicyclobacillus cycloheptanicus]MDQ0189536.1 itaconate CoA-transferase [Alicyclobacillus cycloheptanicus]WDM01591.1 CoA transferase [Alicyclobacillus cycloheptanicus]